MNDQVTYEATVLGDSISFAGNRITTLGVTFPRFLLPQFNTTRMFSRNFASDRALPTEKLIDMVRHSPFVPSVFNERVTGMGVGEPLTGDALREARHVWLSSARFAADTAQRLVNVGVDKSRVNRILEPYLWVTGIVTATDWDNFLALRNHDDAQPEIHTLARMIASALALHEPEPVKAAEDWHLPLLTPDEHETLRCARYGSIARMKLVSAGRCARVSYWRHDELESQRHSIERALRLLRSGHMSPFEHQARPWTPAEHGVLLERQLAERARCQQAGQEPDERFLDSLFYTANFRGWQQFRREFPNEHRFDLLMAEVPVTA